MAPVASIVMALVFGGVFLQLTGYDPFEVYSLMFKGAFGSRYGLIETVVKATPILLATIGVSVAFRMLLWNIGAEGQIYMGAFAASWVALSFPDWPPLMLIPAMFIAGAVAGGLWALLPALPRAIWGVNEIITTLMLNYVAIYWVDYLVYGPWKDPKGFNFPLTPQFSQAAWLPCLGTTRIHLGLTFGLAAAVAVSIMLSRTRWGYEIRVIGENPAAARYAGMDIPRNIVLVMLLSGAIAGIAGMGEVAGITHRLQHGISPGYGYTAIIVAWLAKLNPAGIVIASFLFGGLLVAGYAVQIFGIPADIATMLQGSLLFFVLGGEALARYRVRFVRVGVGKGAVSQAEAK
ncbi:MAG: ABC transporter permease [Bacillota bacterium]|nr:ABC transporter permease [Bacillota bacterium]